MHHLFGFLGSFGVQEIIVVTIMLFFVIVPIGLVIWAIIDLLKRTTMNDTNRIIWALVILFVPFFGAVLYLVVGRRSMVS